MMDYKYRPEGYFSEGVTSVILIRLFYPESQWGEQITIYAHLAEGKIQFEVVDFYGNEYVVYPNSSWEPLSLEDAIYLVESMQINQDLQEGNMTMVLDGIPEAESSFYPDIQIYFREKRKSFGLD